MITGYIKLYRKIFDNPVLNKDKDYLDVFIYLLVNATHEEKVVKFLEQEISLKQGQLVTGRKKIAEKCQVNESKVTRILKCLQNEHQIEQQTTNKYRIITIVNWGKYQFSEQQNDGKVNTNKNIRNNYYNYLEIIYMRPISIPEIEMLDYLLDKYDNDLVVESLKNSCINNVKNLKYVKKTLENWKSEGKNKIEDLNKTESEDNQPNIPIEIFDYDWLNEKNGN